MSESKWKQAGVRVVHADQLDLNTPQTPGMNRAAAITHARAGAEKLWAGTVVIHPRAKTGAHHHGPVESVIYVVSGKARMKWGDRLEFTAEAGPGDITFLENERHLRQLKDCKATVLVVAAPLMPRLGESAPPDGHSFTMIEVADPLLATHVSRDVEAD